MTARAFLHEESDPSAGWDRRRHHPRTAMIIEPTSTVMPDGTDIAWLLGTTAASQTKLWLRPQRALLVPPP